MRFQRFLSARECVAFVFSALLAIVSSVALLYPDAARAASHAPSSFDVLLEYNGSGAETLTLFNEGTTDLSFSVRTSTGERSLVVLSPDQEPPTSLVTDLNGFPGISAELYSGNLAELTGADLLSYDIAILHNSVSWGWPDVAVTVGDALADFIDANGKAVIFNMSYATPSYSSRLEGRFIAEDYGPILPGTGAVSLYGPMDKVEPNHPILDGVGNVHYNLGLVFDNPVQPDATLIAEWSSRPAIAANDQVVAFNMSYTDFSEEGILTGEIDVATYNAIMYLDLLGWLSFGTETGTVPAGGQTSIDVHFDAAGLAAGVYEGDIAVDIGGTTLTVPTTLTVVDNRPWLEGTVTSLGFCSQDPQALEGALIEIAGSQGGNYAATSDADGFYQLRIEASETPLNISVTAANHLIHGEAGVVLAPAGTTVVDFDLTLEGCSSYTPENFDIKLLVGESGTETLTLFNDGLTELDFSLVAYPGDLSVVVLSPDWPAPSNLIDDLNSFPGITAGLYTGNLGNITGADLASYDVAVLSNNHKWNSQWSTANISVGNALADFIDEGGHAVVLNHAYIDPDSGWQLNGRFMDENYGPFLPSATSWHGNWSMVPLLPDHPVLSGVFAASATSWVMDVSVQPGATLIAEWDDGWPMVAASDNVVAINLLYSDMGEPPGWAGDIDRLVYNAVMHFKPVDWLGVDPEAGTMSSGNTFNIDLHFDTTGLVAGVYEANILVDLSDSLGPVGLLVVPVSLTVAEPAIVEGTISSLGYCSDDPSVLEGAQIEVQGSQGGTWSATSGPDGFYQLEIDADESPVTISVTAAGHLGNSETGVVLMPNATSVADIDLVLNAGCTRHDPQGFDVELFVDESGTEELTLVNDGAGPSDFSITSIETSVEHGMTVNHVIERPAVAASSAVADENSRVTGEIMARPFERHEVTLGLRQDDLSAVVLSPDDIGPTNLVTDLSGFPGVTAELFPGNLGTITGADLASYDVAVLVNNSGWETVGANVSVGNALADFIDAGGKAVVFNYAYDDPQWGFQLDGRFIADGYGPFLPATGEAFSASTMVMLDPDHPILDGVSTLANGSIAPRINNPLQSDATLIAEWADGFPLIAYDDDVVAINALYSVSGTPGDWTGDLDLIAFNAVQFIAGGAETAEWLSFDPEYGTVPSAGEFSVDVHFDAAGLAAGVYEADVVVEIDDGASQFHTLIVPASLTVLEPQAMVEGTISSLGHCSDNPSALEGVQIELVSQLGTYTTTSGPDGDYQIELDAIEGPATVSVTAAGHFGDSETDVVLVPHGSTTVDFDLVLDASCVTVAPDDLGFTLYPGESGSASLEIGNVNGGGVLDWTTFTAETPAVDPRAHFPAVPYVAERGDVSGLSALADVGPALGEADGGGWLRDAAVPVYTTTGWDSPGYITLDALVPGSYTLINVNQPTNIFAATFIDNDFSTHYGVAASAGDLPINSFIAIDTETGAFETLGTVTGGPAGGFNSLTWDYTTSTLFGASSDSLYTIDPETYQAQLVGSFGMSGALMAAIATSPEGLLYGIDIASVTLVAIDKTSGAGASIGALGFDAYFAQDMDFDQSDGTLYWGGYFGGGNSQVMTVETATGAATPIGPVQGGTELLSFSIALPGQTGCFSAVDIEWLEVAPVSGSTAAGSSDLVTVSVNASGLAPGLYEADVCVSTNDPVHSLMTVPVSLLVEVPPAVVSGTVRGLGYCSADPAGLAGALVEAQGSDGGSFSVTTDGSGFYQFEVFAEDSPLTISTGFDGHNDASITVEFEPGEQVNGDLDLLLSIPCAAVLPDRLDINLDAGSSLTGQIEVSNATGGAPLVWNIDSAEVSGDDDAVRLVQCDDPEGFSWLKFSPMFGVTPAGTASHINVTLDAGSLQPGQYQAGLCIASNDAHHTLQSVPINLNVRTPGTWGDGLDGTVQSLGYCGDNPAPLEGATVTVVGTGFSEPTDADGYFSFALDPDQGPYELTVTHPDHLPASESGINPPATVDFDLALDAACATVDPEAIVGSALTGGTDLQTLTISNHGAADLNWTMETANVPAGQQVLPPFAVDSGAARSDLSLDLAELLGGELPSLSMSQGEYGLRVVDCENAPGLMINDDGTVENGYGANAAVVSEVRFVDRFTPEEYPATLTGVCVAFITIDGATSFNIEVIAYDDSGAGGTPGVELGRLAATVDVDQLSPPVPPNHPPVWNSIDLSSLGIEVTDGSVYVGVTYVPQTISYFMAADQSTDRPVGHAGGFWWTDNTGVWTPVQTDYPEYRSLMIRPVLMTEMSGCDFPEDVPWLSTSPTSGTVAGGDSTTVDVMLDATGLVPGTYEAELCVNSNDASNPLISVPVSLEVLELDPAELGVDPAALDFGAVPVGGEVTQNVSVSNLAETGADVLVITGLDLSGDAEFSISGGDCVPGMELEPGDSCRVEIGFAPGAATAFSGEVTVTASDGQATVALSGAGRADPPADPIFSDRFEEVDADDEG